MENRQSLRYFLENLEPAQRVEFRVKRRDYMLSALEGALEARKRFPVIELVDPQTGARTVANVFADRDTLSPFLADCAHVEQRSPGFPRVLRGGDDAPVQQVVVEEPDVDVLSLPVYRHFQDDAGRYITSGIVVCRDPDTGRHNLSFHRMMLQGKHTIGISLHSHGDAWKYFCRAQELGQDLEIAVVIGAAPAFYVTGASKIPEALDDYQWAGALLDEPAQLTKAHSVDVYVPAFAEYVLEGCILHNTFAEEGPFAEYTGYGTSCSSRNVFEVRCITHRKDPIWQDLVPGYSFEHILLSQYCEECTLLDKVRREIPEVTAINLPKNGCHFHAYVSLKPGENGKARQVMMLLFGLDLYLKLVVVVDDDVDVYNEEEVIKSMATWFQADRDMFVVPNAICNRLDPSAHDGMSAKLGIDATAKNREMYKVKLPETIQEWAGNQLR